VADGGPTPAWIDWGRQSAEDGCTARRGLLHRRPHDGFSGDATMGLSGDATAEDHRRGCCWCERRAAGGGVVAWLVRAAGVL
jgi:hypothetical protein